MTDDLSMLKPCQGERRARTRLGRGEGSGKGKTSGRGTKGAKSRSGSCHRAGFEGGQMPLARRLPKKGFTNIFAKAFSVINLERLGSLQPGSVVTAKVLLKHGLIRKVRTDGVKVLGKGEIRIALHVRVAKISQCAREKILAAGGTIEDEMPLIGASRGLSPLE